MLTRINTQFHKKSFARVLRSMFYPYEGYRSVTPLDAARVNRTIFRDHSVHCYYITLIKGRDYIKHDIDTPYSIRVRHCISYHVRRTWYTSTRILYTTW